ncbi:hypothetical protein Q9189_000370 [Teloschistes chrysophthalmus]
MPPGRRGRPPGSTSASSRRDSTNAQSTLAFSNSNNRITKPSKPSPATGKKPSGSASPSIKNHEDVIKAIDDELVKAPQIEDATDDKVVNEAPILAEGREQELAIRQSQQKKEETKKDEARERAGKISDVALTSLSQKTSTPTSHDPPRKDPPPLRPLVTIRPLHRPFPHSEMEARGGVGSGAAD